jgi:hypothetical protein
MNDQREYQLVDYKLTDFVIRQRDGSATFDFMPVDRQGRVLEDEHGPNEGMWIMLDVSPN